MLSQTSHLAIWQTHNEVIQRLLKGLYLHKHIAYGLFGVGWWLWPTNWPWWWLNYHLGCDNNPGASVSMMLMGASIPITHNVKYHTLIRVLVKLGAHRATMLANNVGLHLSGYISNVSD